MSLVAQLARLLLRGVAIIGRAGPSYGSKARAMEVQYQIVQVPSCTTSYSSASGSSDPEGMVGLSCSLALIVTGLFFNSFSFSLFPAFLHPLFFVFFHSCCFHAQVFGRTLLHEFHLFYSHTKWNLCFFALLGQTLFWLEVAVELNTIIIIALIYTLPSLLL